MEDGIKMKKYRIEDRIDSVDADIWRNVLEVNSIQFNPIQLYFFFFVSFGCSGILVGKENDNGDDDIEYLSNRVNAMRYNAMKCA